MNPVDHDLPVPPAPNKNAALRRRTIGRIGACLCVLALLAAGLWAAGFLEAIKPDAKAPARAGKTAPLSAASKEIWLDLGGNVTIKLVRIPAGKFRMGSAISEPGRNDDEQQHEVTIARPFYLSILEVTQVQYAHIMGNNPNYFSATGQGRLSVEGVDTSNFPVEMVTWHDAVQFCEKVSQIDNLKTAGWQADLPTEAEWEYACRAGTTTAFHFGDVLSAQLANFNEEQKRTTKAGHYQPNAWGLFDMHGNLWEWCKDWYDDKAFTANPRTDPTGPNTGQYRVVRGGLWGSLPQFCRSAYRYQIEPGYCSPYLGFRLVLRLPAKSR